LQWFRLALSKGTKRAGVSHLSPENGNIHTFWTLCFLVFRIPDDGHSRHLVILSVTSTHNRQNLPYPRF
jgi:hypothetical protein